MRALSSFWRGDALSAEAEHVLHMLAAGGTLKAHRTLDGEKTIRLHPLNGTAVDVSASAMRQLKRRRLLESNMKFPAATYLLTERGHRVLQTLTDQGRRPLVPQQSFSD